MSQLDKYQRAVQLWSLLVLAARNQQLLSYTTVEHLTGIPKVGVGGMLGTISHYCKSRNLPWLTALVVSEETGLPGEGLMDSAKQEYGEAVDLFAMQSRVFVYDRFKEPAPKTEDFKRTDT
jgi:hypothetical protein